MTSRFRCAPPERVADWTMARNLLCVLLGHRWDRRRRPDRTVLLTCRRCGTVDAVTEDFGAGLGGGSGPL